MEEVLMCGIIGFFSHNPTKEDKDLLAQLYYQSKIRGLHAFGLAVEYLGELKIHKSLSLPEIMTIIRSVEFTALAGHTRYSTSGDYKELGNNQPVLVDKKALVFNGVISMMTKKENEEKYGIRMETDNDGEIFLQSDDFEKFIKTMPGSFSGIYYTDEFYVLRNPRRPAWTATTGTATYVASTRDIFRRAGFGDESMKEVEPFQVQKLSGLWNLA